MCHKWNQTGFWHQFLSLGPQCTGGKDRGSFRSAPCHSLPPTHLSPLLRCVTIHLDSFILPLLASVGKYRRYVFYLRRCSYLSISMSAPSLHCCFSHRLFSTRSHLPLLCLHLSLILSSFVLFTELKPLCFLCFRILFCLLFPLVSRSSYNIQAHNPFS